MQSKENFCRNVFVTHGYMYIHVLPGKLDATTTLRADSLCDAITWADATHKHENNFDTVISVIMPTLTRKYK